VPPIRILLAGPRLFTDLIERLIGSTPDVVIVGTSPADDRMMRSALALEADAIVAGTAADLAPESFDAALYEHPTVKLVIVAPSVDRATLSELRPIHTPVDQVSRDGLLDAIRSAVATMPAGRA